MLTSCHRADGNEEEEGLEGREKTDNIIKMTHGDIIVRSGAVVWN